MGPVALVPVENRAAPTSLQRGPSQAAPHLHPGVTGPFRVPHTGQTCMHSPWGTETMGGGLATWDPELSAGTARVLTVNVHSQDSHLSGLGRVLHNSWPPSLNTGRLCLTAPEVCGCAAVIVRQTLLLKQGGSSVRERQLDPLSNPRIA